MLGAVGLCVLAACVVWQSSASSTIILRSRRHRSASVTPKNFLSSTSVPAKSNASLPHHHQAPVTNQPSVSLSVILENLKNSTGSEKEASDKNPSSESPIVTTGDQEYDTTRSEDATNGQSSERPSVTLKYQKDNNTNSTEKYDENPSTDSLRRDYNNSGSEEEPDDNQSSDIPPEIEELVHERLNEVVDEEKQSVLTPVQIHTKTRLQELLHMIILMEPHVNNVILNLKPRERFNCTTP